MVGVSPSIPTSFPMEACGLHVLVVSSNTEVPSKLHTNIWTVPSCYYLRVIVFVPKDRMLRGETKGLGGHPDSIHIINRLNFPSRLFAHTYQKIWGRNNFDVGDYNSGWLSGYRVRRPRRLTIYFYCLSLHDDLVLKICTQLYLSGIILIFTLIP